MNNTPFKKNIFKPIIFGVYFVFFFAQLNYISKYYSSQPVGYCSNQNYKGGKKDVFQSSQRQNESKAQIRLNKRYYPKNLFETPANQVLVLPEICIRATERILTSTPISDLSLLSTFQRGPPFIFVTP
jgi:hypothetical protein